LDQFGQKAAGGGNYKLAITAEAGVNEVQKSDIFKIKHEGSSTEVDEVQAGAYDVGSQNAEWGIDLSSKNGLTGTFTISFEADGQTYTSKAITFTGAYSAKLVSSIRTGLAGADSAAFTSSTFAVTGTSLATLNVEFTSALATTDVTNFQLISGTLDVDATQGVANITLAARDGSVATLLTSASSTSSITIQATGSAASTSNLTVQFMTASAEDSYLADPNTLVVVLTTAGISADALVALVGGALSAAFSAGYTIAGGGAGLFTAPAHGTASMTVGPRFGGGTVITVTKDDAGPVTPELKIQLTVATSDGTAAATTSYFDSSSYTLYVSLGTQTVGSATAAATAQTSIDVSAMASIISTALSAETALGTYSVEVVYTSALSFLGAVYVAGATTAVLTGDAGTFQVTGGYDDATVSAVQTGYLSSAVSEIQDVTVEGATGGTFTLTHTVSEVQNLAVGTANGTFTFTVGTATTSALGESASASAIQAALEGLGTVGSGNVTVESTGTGAFRIRFDGSIGASGMTVSAAGASAALTLGTAYAQAETGEIAYNATAAQVQSALESLSTIGTGNVTVAMSGDSWQVTFAGTQGGIEQNLLEIDGGSLIKAPGEIGDLASGDTKLYDIDRFWDSSGNFVLETPQTITLVQGDGSKATFTLSEADTINDVVSKLNVAIGEGLAQLDVDALTSANATNFVSYVEEGSEDADGLESVAGTFVIRSAIAGNEGKITFVGDDATINALSLTVIQQARNNYYEVDVIEAHAGTLVAEDVKLAENKLVGIVHQNVDVEFASSEGIQVSWDADAKNFVFAGGSANATATYVHLADRTMVLHIGANQKQDIGTGIGNMGADALGISGIQVTSNGLANKAIGLLDNAISTVSSERAKLGALQNRLDHTINNLGVSMENLTAAESRIRDADMAKEIMEFTKLQILLQSANAMLGQANQLPQNVLQLLR